MSMCREAERSRLTDGREKSAASPKVRAQFMGSAGDFLIGRSMSGTEDARHGKRRGKEVKSWRGRCRGVIGFSSRTWPES